MNRIQVLSKKENISKHIGIIIPSTTKGSRVNNIEDLIFFRIFLPSFLKYSSNKHYYNFFLGYDYDDPFYSIQKNRKEIEKKFNDICPKTYTFTFYQFPQTLEKGDLSSMWSILADQAVKNNEYLYQVGDDIEFKSKGWENLFITLLSKTNNIGAVGPKDEGNRSGILTQSFVHCTHLSIFKHYFPKELKNWYIDDWMSEIYDVRVEKRALINNMGGKERYKVEKMEREKNELVKKDRELINKIKSYSGDKIFKIKSLNNSIYMDHKHLVITGKNLSIYNSSINQQINSRQIKTYIEKLKTPELSFIINGEKCHRNENYISFIEEDGTKVIQNIENLRIEEIDEPIFLFQQFFIPSNEERYNEVKECIKKNVEDDKFDKIYLLNERIYSDEELGVKNDKIVQINIGQRLTYESFFNHIHEKKGFIVLSNGDIFFDKTIKNVRTSVMREIKSVQCLRRYEYVKGIELDRCNLCPDIKSAQDTWIFHISKIKKIRDCNFFLGTPGCDNKFAHILRINDFVLLNDYQNIKTYHNHNSLVRNYTNKNQLSRPFTFVFGSQIYTNVEKIMNLENLFWQYPVITEKTFYEQNKKDPKYIGLPWATIIDKNPDINTDRMISMLKIKNSYTCCQHISFKKLIPLFKHLGIIKLFTPHKIFNEDQIDGIQILPCPLYAKIIEENINDFNIDILSIPRKYLYSFKGAYQKGYMSDIRLKIFSKETREDIYIENIGEWHFNQIVYNQKQNKKGEYNGDVQHYQKESCYRDLLLDSRYTLCPSGSGPNSIRFWESLGAGSIPILLSDKLQLPYRDDWDKSIIIINEDNFDQLDKILSKIDEKTEDEMRKRCFKIYQEIRNNYKGNY